MRAAASLALCALLLAAALADAAPAGASHADRALIRKINAYRAHHGLDPVRSSRHLARSSRRQARRIARSGRPRHGSLRRDLRRYRRVGEVIEWHKGGPRPRATIASWRGSRGHRRVLLDRRLTHIGVGRAVGRVNGVRCTIWVARLGMR